MARPDIPGHPLAQKLLWLLLRLLMRLLRLEIRGVENVPRTGPVVVVINHIAFLDPVILCGALPRWVTPIAKKEAFDWPVSRFLMSMYGTIPIDRGEADISAIRMALRILKNGGLILLAPEGTRSPTHQLQPGKEGAIMLAVRGGAPIVPIGVTGTHQVKTYWKKLRRAPVSLAIGKPFYLRSPATKGRVARSEMALMTRETMYRLAEQLPKEYRGVYQNLKEATETYLVPIKG